MNLLVILYSQEPLLDTVCTIAFIKTKRKICLYCYINKLKRKTDSSKHAKRIAALVKLTRRPVAFSRKRQPEKRNLPASF